MAQESNRDKLKKLASQKSSGWLEKAKKRVENAAWLDKSARIALRVLAILREKSLTRQELAEKLEVSEEYVSQLVKGQENLTLETIAKLEETLGKPLVEIPAQTKSTVDVQVIYSKTIEYPIVHTKAKPSFILLENIQEVSYCV